MYPRLQHPTEHSYENGRRRNPTAVSCVVEHRGIEPLTSGLQSPRSPS